MNATVPDANLVTCKCNHCSGHIEFDASEMGFSGASGSGGMGPTVQCPHCGLDTILYVPSKPKAEKKTDPVVALPPPIVQPKRTRSISMLGPIILVLIGIVLIVNGCNMELQAQSAMHQTTAAINYCAGWLMIGLAFILDGIRSITRNQ